MPAAIRTVHQMSRQYSRSEPEAETCPSPSKCQERFYRWIQFRQQPGCRRLASPGDGLFLVCRPEKNAEYLSRPAAEQATGTMSGRTPRTARTERQSRLRISWRRKSAPPRRRNLRDRGMAAHCVCLSHPVASAMTCRSEADSRPLPGGCRCAGAGHDVGPSAAKAVWRLLCPCRRTRR